MDVKVAHSVNANLNHPSITIALQEYADYRINKLRDQLEVSKDSTKISELQGAIEELRKLYKIRDTALAVLENDRKG